MWVLQTETDDYDHTTVHASFASAVRLARHNAAETWRHLREGREGEALRAAEALQAETLEAIAGWTDPPPRPRQSPFPFDGQRAEFGRYPDAGADNGVGHYGRMTLYWAQLVG